MLLFPTITHCLIRSAKRVERWLGRHSSHSQKTDLTTRTLQTTLCLATVSKCQFNQLKILRKLTTTSPTPLTRRLSGATSSTQPMSAASKAESKNFIPPLPTISMSTSARTPSSPSTTPSRTQIKQTRPPMLSMQKLICTCTLSAPPPRAQLVAGSRATMARRWTVTSGILLWPR